jgi:hypothetical protein
MHRTTHTVSDPVSIYVVAPTALSGSVRGELT